MSVALLLTNNLDNSKQKRSNLLGPAPPHYSWSSLLGKFEGPAPHRSYKISWSFDLAWNLWVLLCGQGNGFEWQRGTNKQDYINNERLLWSGGAGIAQWLERRTRDWKVAGSNPCWNGGRIFFSRVDFLCWLLFRYPFHPRVTAVARKKSRSFCQKCRWQVTAKHAYTLRIEPCFGIGHNLSLICQMTSEDIKHQLNNNNNSDRGSISCRVLIIGNFSWFKYSTPLTSRFDSFLSFFGWILASHWSLFLSNTPNI